MSSLSTPVKAVGGLVLLVVLGVGFYLVRPLFTDTVVDEAFPMSAGAVVPDGMTREDVEAEMAAAADSAPTEMAEELPGQGTGGAEPVAVVAGMFVGADDFHQASGSATIYALDDGSNVLRFEDFEVTNGPDLRVYLSPLDADGVPQIDAADSIELGSLSGNIGNQNYDIPAGYDVTQPLGVVIWCQPFRVTFATAVLG